MNYKKRTYKKRTYKKRTYKKKELIPLNHLPVLLKTVPEDQAANYSCLTLLRVALVFKDHLLLKKNLHHDALS